MSQRNHNVIIKRTTCITQYTNRLSAASHYITGSNSIIPAFPSCIIPRPDKANSWKHPTLMPQSKLPVQDNLMLISHLIAGTGHTVATVKQFVIKIQNKDREAPRPFPCTFLARNVWRTADGVYFCWFTFHLSRVFTLEAFVLDDCGCYF